MAGGTAWVANVGNGVARYDAATGRRLGSVGPGLLSVCTGMDVGHGSLWVAACTANRLHRFDLATGRQQAAIRLPAGGIAEEGSVAAGGSGVFVVAADAGRIVRVDPRSQRVVARLPAPEGAAGLRFGFGSLWVTSPTEGTLTRLDPSTGRVQATVPVGAGAYFLAIGEGAVWVMNNFEAQVLRVDPADNSVTATVEVSEQGVEGGDIAVGGGAVWARVSDVLVARIDPSTNRVVDRIGQAQGSGGVAADANAVWISAHDVRRVYRVPLE